MRRDTLTVRARHILPVEGAPIEDGCLTIQGPRIGWIGPAADRAADIDLGNVAIVPGFVNAHTHLELSSLSDESPTIRVEDELEWLRRVIGQRRGSSDATYRVTAAENVRSSIAAGTTLLADSTTAGLSWGPISGAPIRAVVFAEVIGLRRDRGLMTDAAAWEWLKTVRPEAQVAACSRVGLSPHAPYSTSGWLYHKAVSSRFPLMTHLAEMPEELELLETREGPMREFLEEIGAWDDEWEPIGPRPSDYVRRGELRNADWLIAHGTYIDPEDFWQFRPEAAPDNKRVAIAFCPRTHARFGHKAHPYRQLLERGAIVCLGTDSLASAETLGILDEMRFLHRRDESLSGELLLTMATLFGAWALRAELSTGSLKVGKSADLAVVDLPDRDDADPYRLLLESDRPVAATVFEGDFVVGRWMNVV